MSDSRVTGFAGVEVHAANGYLLHQFLAQGTNHRTEMRRAGDAGSDLSRFNDLDRSEEDRRMTSQPIGTGTTTEAFVISDVSKVFVGKAPVQALAGIDLVLETGSFTCIVGPSGCGKSTLLRILGELETATAGRVHTRLPETRVPRSAFV